MCPALSKDSPSPNEQPYDAVVLRHLRHLSCKENTSHGSSLVNAHQRERCYVENPDSNDSVTKDEVLNFWKKQFSSQINQALKTTQLLVDLTGDHPVFKLKQPVDLFTFGPNCYPFNGVRWPIECEVINDVIQHIEWDPPKPEEFYQLTGEERMPVPVAEENGLLVYCTDISTKTPYFTCSRIGGSGPLKKAHAGARYKKDPPLDFESRFESGNLHKAVQVSDYEYELTLSTDMYTNKHTQWFYFRVRNMKAGVTYRFTIVNLMKARSLYSLGMRPLLYSERASASGIGWQRIGSDIKYFRNYMTAREEAGDNSTLYSLTWTLQFPYDSDTCYLAHCYPYTYSHLQHYLSRVTSDPLTAAHCRLRVMCHSLGGNPVHMLTITSPASSWVAGKTKKAVVVTARVHPGETNCSWMMEGFLDFLLGDSDDAQLLRDTFVFKVVPMLNPDGVVVGNYRCSLSGKDLNRNYKSVLKNLFPCVWHTRNMVQRLMAERDVVLYCDFHGHSRKNNVFMYGCNDQDASQHLHERIFPLMMSKNAKDKFSFRSCKFRVKKSKEGTGRIVMWRMGIRNSYTLESTFGGSTLGSRRGTHFTTRDLKSLGYYFCDTLLDYCDPDPSKTAYCLTELRQEVGKQIGENMRPSEEISISDLESSTSGSNSSDSDGLLVHLINQTGSGQKQGKKHLRTCEERNRQREKTAKTNTGSEVKKKSSKNTEPAPSSKATRIEKKAAARTKRKEKKECPEEPHSTPKLRYHKAAGEAQRVRAECTTKLLYLTALHPPKEPQASNKLVQRALWSPQAAAIYRPHSGMQGKVVPKHCPTRSSSAQSHIARNATKVSVHYFVPKETSYISFMNLTKSNPQDQQGDATEANMLTESMAIDKAVQRLRHEARPTLSEPILRSSKPEPNKRERVLPPVSRTLGLFRLELPDFQLKDLRTLCLAPGTGISKAASKSRDGAAPEEGKGIMRSQSAPLHAATALS